MPPAIAAVNSDFESHANLAELVADLHSLIAKSAAADSGVGLVFQRVFEVAAVAEQTIADQRSRINYLEGLSVTDELTGLYNRRGFGQVLEKVLANSRRHSERGMLAFIDLDRFKIINDTFGHEAGDLVLKRVADALAGVTRTTDYIARLGGDEFVILFCRAQQMPTRARAMQINEMLNNLTIDYDGRTIPIECSMGLEIYGPYSEADELLRQADYAMYRDKERRQSV